MKLPTPHLAQEVAVTDHKTLNQAMHRAKALGERITADITQRIQGRTGLEKLDELFAQHKRQHQLYMRLYIRWEAARPQ